MIWLLIIPLFPYLFIILEIYRNLLKEQKIIPAGISGESVSVVIACRNEEENLPKILGDLSCQDYDDRLYEVIIVDDNSSDGTWQVASAFNGINNYRVIRNASQGKKSAIRSGVEVAAGKLIITTDADCRMDKSWISSLAGIYSASKADMIIAAVQSEKQPGFGGAFRNLEFLSLQGVTAGSAKAGFPVMCNGANLAFTRDTYLRHSGNLHNEIPSGDDIFFLHSLKKEKDSKIVWAGSSSAAVTTRLPDTLLSFITQRARWISKAKAYSDRFTRMISAATFLAVALNIVLLICAIFNPEFIPLFIASFVLKSVPDFLILSETTRLYNKRFLMKWFLPAQVVYPFYVLAVLAYSLFFRSSWK
jgi:poly-beta-1,6-N-acetyl-D-glucosamine synthase